MIIVFRKKLVFVASVLLLPFLLLQPALLTAADSAAASGWKSMAVGSTHNLGVKLDGTVWIWGSGTAELFGNNGDFAVQELPVQVEGLSRIVQVAAGGSHSLALRDDGSVWAWGGNTEGELGDGTKSVYDGLSRSYITNENKSVPLQVKGVKDILFIAAGHASSYAVKKDGTVWAWGSLIGTKPVQLTEYSDVQSISVGYAHSVVLKKDGTVWQLASSLPSYRDGQYQNLGSTTLVQVKELTNVIEVAAGGGTTHALKDDGSVWGWGFNHEGEVGDGTTIDRLEPVKITGIRDVIAIAASAGGPFYLKQDGSLWSNGSNLGGQLGIGSYEGKLAPTRIEGLVKIKRIASSGIGFRAMAIRQDNSLWSWGNGYVGDGTKWWRTSPAWIKGHANDSVVPLPLTVEVNGTAIDFDQQPIVKEGRTLVPLRQIFEALGAEIEWNETTRTVTAVKGNTTMKLTIGEQVGYVNGAAVKLETPAITLNGRTLVPARLVSETFEAVVDWDEDTRTVRIEVEEMETEEDASEESAIDYSNLRPDEAAGRIVGKDGAGIPGLEVFVQKIGDSGNPVFQTTTDKNGQFIAAGLEKDQTYRVNYSHNFRADRPVISHEGINYCRNVSDTFTFTPLQPLDPIALGQVQLTGEIVDQNNKPVADVFVIFDNGGDESVESRRFRTDSNGTYSLCGLVENKTYKLRLLKVLADAKTLIEFPSLSFTYRSNMTTLPESKVTITNK